MRTIGWILLGALSAPVMGQAPELEGMGDVSLAQGQFELAKAYYKQALMESPRDEALWLKLERALEAYYQEVFAQSAGLTSPGGQPRAFAPLLREETPAPEPAARKEPALKSPEEVVRLTRPVRPGKELLIAGPGGDEPVIIRGNNYEIDQIRFTIDRADVLHVRGRVENVSTADLRDPRVFVHLYDSNNNQWATGFSDVQPGPRTLFPGKVREFEVKFPSASRNLVGGFRIRLLTAGS